MYAPAEIRPRKVFQAGFLKGEREREWVLEQPFSILVLYNERKRGESADLEQQGKVGTENGTLLGREHDSVQNR